MSHFLIFFNFLPFIGALITSLVPLNFGKQVSLFTSLLSLFLSIILWLGFDKSCSKFQFVDTFFWLNSNNFYLSFGIDGISIFFIILTAFLIPFCLLSSWKNIPFVKNINNSVFFIFFLLMEGLIFIIFTSLDLLVFYIFFESVLIPIFLVIGIWGGRVRKVRASYLFFLYTLFGSLFILIGLVVIFFEVGSFDYFILLNHDFSFARQKIIWLCFFISFAVKVPIMPVHLWLPEAHVEAPTAGSVLLAGVLLKLGGYGLIRFSLPLFPDACFFFRPFVFCLGIIAVIYTSFIAIRQSDIKRVIAYASVAHMNITLLGLFSLTLAGIEGCIFQIFSHGLVSGALFLCVGVLYDRNHSRIISYYSGLVQTMPLFSFFFVVFSMANIALPGTSSFIGEFVIFIGLCQISWVTTFFSATGMVLGGCYSLWLLNRLIYGHFKNQFLVKSIDISRLEFNLFGPLFTLVIFLGVYPNCFFDTLHISAMNLLFLVLLNCLLCLL